jgi:hypothetical protein
LTLPWGKKGLKMRGGGRWEDGERVGRRKKKKMMGRRIKERGY